MRNFSVGRSSGTRPLVIPLLSTADYRDRMEQAAMTARGNISVIHDNNHQIPPCPISAERRPNPISNASAVGQRQICPRER